MKRKTAYRVYLIKDNRFSEVTYHEAFIGTYRTKATMNATGTISFKIKYLDRIDNCIKKQKVILTINAVKIVDNKKILVTTTLKQGG